MSYVESLNNNAQTKTLQQFARGELEIPNAYTYLNMLNVTKIMDPSHDSIVDRSDRIADSYMFKRNATPIQTSAPSHNHTNGKSTSMSYTPSFNPVKAGFSMHLKQGGNNVFKQTEMLSNEYSQKFIDLLEGQEELALDFLWNNKSQVDTSNYSIGSWNITNSTYEIPLADIAAPNNSNGIAVKQIADSVMIGNNQKGRYYYFCDDTAFDRFTFGKAQGSGNNVNLNIQEGNVTYVRSSNLNSAGRFGSVATYNNGVFVAAQVGTFGILDWISPQNTEGVSNEASTYATVINPLDKQKYALHYYRARADGTLAGLNGDYQDQITQWELWAEKAFVIAPNSTPNKTSFKAFALV